MRPRMKWILRTQLVKSEHPAPVVPPRTPRQTRRSKEQLELDISALEIQMNSQERRAKLQKAKLDIELDIEQNELQTQMDIAKKGKRIIERPKNKNDRAVAT